MRHRTNDRRAIDDPGRQRQQLADLHARHAGRDGTQLAADFDGGVRLGIERLNLAGRAVEIEQDAALGLTKGGIATLVGCRRGGRREPRHRSAPQAEHPQRAGLQQVTAGQAVA